MYRKQGDDERANQSFELAQSFSSSRQGRHLETISLVRPSMFVYDDVMHAHVCF